MRVKLSYTVSEEDVLKESAKILNMGGDDMQQVLNLFKSIPEELVVKTGDENAIPNTFKVLDMIEEFRQALLNLDTRFREVIAIVEGYDEYIRTKAHAAASTRPVVEPEDSAPAELK